MGRFDNEENIVNDVRIVSRSDTAFLTNSKFERTLYNAIIRDWHKWTANNSHASDPPDFFLQNHRLMFDVMRVNDSETLITTKRGKTKYANPVLKREKELVLELKQHFPNTPEDNIFVNAAVDGNYDEVHNYQNYYKHTQKVLSSHIERIPICRELHPSFKIGFLVMDETESYLQHSNIMDAATPFNPSRAYKILSLPHIPYRDRRFMQCLFGSGLDFVIWYMPYKHNENINFQPPPLCFIDMRGDRVQKYLQDYPQHLMRRM